MLRYHITRRGLFVPHDPKRRERRPPSIETPGHGDLLVMRGITNVEWGHWVPKTAKQVGERINLTFRNKEV